jgi:hypothetical protein
VDLGGYYLTGTLTNKTKFLIPNNTHYLIPPHGFFLVWADNNNAQNSTNRPELHVNFKLSKSGEAIGLFAPDGTAIDALSFGAQTTDVTEGRYPDGTATVRTMPTPTPGAANVVPNTAPMLAPIGNRTVILGQTLALTASATDPDQPPQNLTFTLGAGAPIGAAIHSASGQFSWSPNTAPSTNLVSVIVTDNGIPNLSAMQTFTATVYLPPSLSGYGVSGNQFALTWPAPVGQTYQVEFKDDLNATSWSPFGVPLMGAGTTLAITNQLDDAPQRFFRVRVLP